MSKHETDLQDRISNENLLEIQYQVARALRNMPDSVATRILGNKKELQKLVQGISKDITINPLRSERIISAISMLEHYFSFVYDIAIPEIAELQFPESDAFPALMAVSPKHNEDEIMEAQAQYFGIKTYKYKNPAASNINNMQQRLSGLYVFAHTGEDEPDAQHRGKSHNNAISAGFPFANAKEYLLMTGFHKFTKKYFMDKKGWTRTSSLWSDGGLVCGFWCGAYARLGLNDGYVDDRDSDGGPRELFLL